MRFNGLKHQYIILIFLHQKFNTPVTLFKSYCVDKFLKKIYHIDS